MTIEELAAALRGEADGQAHGRAHNPALVEHTAEYHTAGKIFAGKKDD